jgi:ribosomal protein S18 acetylase RimI-like enzyme
MDVTHGGAADAGAAAALLARAFHEDPAARLLFPERSRPGLLRGHFLSLLRGGSGAALLCGRDPGKSSLAACLIWSGEDEGAGQPGAAGVGALLRHPVSALRIALGAPALRRLAASRPAGSAALLAIGVEPALRGCGRGSLLLDGFLRRLDAEGTCCYLETVAPRNIDFYRRHGFDVAGEVTPPAGVPSWAMVRPASRVHCERDPRTTSR